jgi:ribose 5-phosphate isomerase B
MHIAIGSDHAGFEYKEEIKQYLKKSGYKVTDFGTFSKQSCDYPDFGVAVGEAVAQGKFERGILICNTGIGMSIIANKVPGIRAALCWNTKTAQSASDHNMTNILCLAQGMTRLSEVKKMLGLWLNTPFAGGRHLRRVNKIRKMEKKYLKEVKQK